MKNIRLKEAREKKALTQVEVAQRAGITEVCYQRYESGDRIPRADVAIRIAKTVGRSVEWLFGADHLRSGSSDRPTR